ALYGEGFGGGNGGRRWTCDEARYAAFQPTTPWFLNYLDQPFWGSHPVDRFEADTLGPFYDAVIAAVRAEAPWLAFVEPASSRNVGYPSRLRVASPDAVYAPHAYDAAAESGGGFDPTHPADYIANVMALADEARAMGAALWIGGAGGG